MQRKFMAWGAILAMLAVGIGAFGAHMLESRISEDYMKVYETGVQYHMIHALGIIVIALIVGQWGETARLRWAGILLIAGTIIFSGSLYVLSITGIKVLGVITPIGGVSFIAGWLCLAIEAFSRKSTA